MSGSEHTETGPTRRLKTIRRAAWSLALIMTVAASGIAGWRYFSPPAPPTAKQLGQAMINSEFALTDHRGKPVTHENYRGKWQLVFFGYTFCPDVCPTTLATMAEVLDGLGADANKIAPLFITVDPARDTPDVLKEYVEAFHPKLIGLRGSAEQTKAAAKAFKVYFARADKADAPDGYLMAHSGYIYLMTPDGTFEAVFSENRNPADEIIAEVKKRMAKG